MNAHPFVRPTRPAVLEHRRESAATAPSARARPCYRGKLAGRQRWTGAASGSRVGGGEVAADLVLISGVRGGHRGGAQGLPRVLVLSTKTMRKPTRGGAFASWSVRTVDGLRDAHFHR